MECKERAIFWIWLQIVFGCGSHRINALSTRFDTAQEIYAMTDQQRMDCHAFTPDELQRLREVPLAAARAIFERCQSLGCMVLTPEDAEYPDRLRNIYAMPAVLYVKGQLEGFGTGLSITMVGTRRCTDYGERAGEYLGGQLARYGATVISGLALGVDTACLRGAIRHGGKTIAVIAAGIDVFYPPKNQKVQEWIGKHHTLVTEYPPGSEPARFHFPMRNRLMSGLSLGTVVVEAGERSGALITANHALEQGKDVFAVPARVDDKSSAGCLLLLRQGAKLVCDAEDILCEYEHLYPDKVCAIRKVQMQRARTEQAEGSKEEPPLSKTPLPAEPPEELDEAQAQIYRLLAIQPMTAAALANQSGFSIHILLPVLTELEILGYVHACAPGLYGVSTQG